MNAHEIERDVDAFLGPRVRGSCTAWFEGRDDLVAVLKKKLAQGVPTAAVHDYLKKRHGFPFGITALKGATSAWFVDQADEGAA